MEWYSHTFDTEAEAEEYVHDCRRSTYDALGPYEVEQPVTESTMLPALNEVCHDVSAFNCSTSLCTNYMEWTDADKCPDA